MPKYPTPEQILDPPIKLHKESITLLNQWSKDFPERHTANALLNLIENFCRLYDKPIKGVCFYTPISQYLVYSQTIHLSNFSVITALHELAHHFFGPSELRACRWSIGLFKRAFPEQYQQLEFKGHLLVKKPKTIKPTTICQELPTKDIPLLPTN